MFNDHIDELARENMLKPLFPDNEAASRSDELRSLGSFSVLSEPDRNILASVRRWIRHVWLEATPGSAMTLDGIDHDAVFEVMKQVDDLYARTSTEGMLSRPRTCIDCANGIHTVIGGGPCDCACHGVSKDRINAGECMCQRATCATCNKRHANQAHAAERESVCSGCGGHSINGTCLRNCGRD